MNEEIDTSAYLEKRLDHWAQWVLKGNQNGQGYPSKSSLYDWMKMGGVVVQAQSKPPLPCDDDAEEIERCVMEMAKQRPRIALALRMQYLTSGTIQQKSKTTHLSSAQFKINLQMAKQWLAGWFSARFVRRIGP